MKLKYSHVDIVVRNLDEAVSYYQNVLGWKPSEELKWKNPNFDVRYKVMYNSNNGDRDKIVFVEPKAGALLNVLQEQGEGTIYRLCYYTEDIEECYDELKAKGVNPEDVIGNQMRNGDFGGPAGERSLWLPRKYRNLSIEFIENKEH